MLSPETRAAAEAAHGPMPGDGQRIRCRLRDGNVITGTVMLVWVAMDEPVISVSFHDTMIHVWPGLGDAWEPAEKMPG